MSAPLRLEPGLVVAGRFELRRQIGEGGMGWVWEAADLTKGQSVALKFLKSAKEDDRRRFLREVRAAAAVRHANVVAIHEVVELEDDTLAMVMDLLHGMTLGDVLHRDGRLDLSVVAALLVPVVSALEAAHAAGIVHRDLKPDNIFLLRGEGSSGVGVRVLDFGVAKLTASEGLAARTEALTGTGSMVGTPYYMSPEQVESEKDLDGRADVWSLGVVLYECLTGSRPTEADTVGRVIKRILMADFEPVETHRPDLPVDVALLVKRMLIGDRAERLKDLREVSRVLALHAAKTLPSIIPAKSSGTLRTGAAFAPTIPATRTPTTQPASPRADTHAAVSVTGPHPRTSRRLRTTAIVTAAALTALATWRYALAPTPLPATATSTSTPTPVPVPVPVPVPASASASAPPPAPESSSAPPRASASAPALTRPPTTPSPQCAPTETLSHNHCCARGLEWQGRQCERPLATTF